MKYKDTKSFLKAIQNKSFKGRVIVDNDCVLAYDDGEVLFDCVGKSPSDALFFVLEAIGANVDYA